MWSSTEWVEKQQLQLCCCCHTSLTLIIRAKQKICLIGSLVVSSCSSFGVRWNPKPDPWKISPKQTSILTEWNFHIWEAKVQIAPWCWLGWSFSFAVVYWTWKVIMHGCWLLCYNSVRVRWTFKESCIAMEHGFHVAVANSWWSKGFKLWELILFVPMSACAWSIGFFACVPSSIHGPIQSLRWDMKLEQAMNYLTHPFSTVNKMKTS